MIETYRQCVLRDERPSGYVEYVAWIPSDRVKIGAILTIKTKAGSWRVISAGEPRSAALVEKYAEHSRRSEDAVEAMR